MPLLRTEHDGPVAVITLSRPPHNLLDEQSLVEIAAAFEAAHASHARAILLRSDMRHFCAGAELSSFIAEGYTVDWNRWLAFMRTIENIPIPTVAAVQGGVLGGGLELALHCDFIIAADTAFFGQLEVAVGLLPILGGTQRLSARCGPARAKEIAMFGRRHPAATFERWGIVNAVAPEKDLGETSLAWARQLAAGPTRMLAGIKVQANQAARGGVGAADTLQKEIDETIWATKDRVRGFDAFFASGPASAVYEGD